MPHINIKMYPGKPEAAKQSLADKIIVLAQEELGCPMEALSVSIQEVAPESRRDVERKVKQKQSCKDSDQFGQPAPRAQRRH